jgi:hypothetical protein
MPLLYQQGNEEIAASGNALDKLSRVSRSRNRVSQRVENLTRAIVATQRVPLSGHQCLLAKQCCIQRETLASIHPSVEFGVELFLTGFSE